MTDSEDRFTTWASPYAEPKGRRFAAVVYWRRHLISLTGRRGILELKDVPEHAATLTDKRGEVLFSLPLGELRVRRSWPYCFTIECEGRRWRLWGIGVNSLRAPNASSR